tara:strand:- start:943 stop:1194 length:252 start_codon:yes stop_codon:yes gene_type:complete
MKFLKLSLLIMPLFVLADNPILPADIDAVQETSTQEIVEEVAQAEPAKILDSDSETKSTQSSYQQETPPDLVLLSMIFTILVL